MTPEHEKVAQAILIALTLSFSGEEEKAVAELKSLDQDLAVDFLFGALVGTIEGWALQAEVDPVWLIREMGRRAARVLVGLDPDDEE